MSELDDRIRQEERRLEARALKNHESFGYAPLYQSILDRGKAARRSRIIWHTALAIMGGALLIWLVSYIWWILEGG
jgi:hypothetical protein